MDGGLVPVGHRQHRERVDDDAMSHAHEHGTALSIGHRASHALVLMGAASACVLLYAVDPASENDPYPVCPFRALTGLACPGCGALRATNRLLHGDFGSALGLNALYVLMLPILLYTFAGMAAEVVGKPIPRLTWPRWAGWAIVAVIAAFWVLRNLPVAPFDALAP
jgi:hypothetical protein